MLCYIQYIIKKVIFYNHTLYLDFLLSYIVLIHFFISFIQLVSKSMIMIFFECRNYFGRLQFDSHVVCCRDKQCFEVVWRGRTSTHTYRHTHPHPCRWALLWRALSRIWRVFTAVVWQWLSKLRMCIWRSVLAWMFGGSMTATEIQARCVGTQHPSLHLTPSINPRSLSLPQALHGVVYIFFGIICRMKALCVKMEEASCWCPSAFRPSLFISSQMCCLPVVGPGVRGRSPFVCCPITVLFSFFFSCSLLSAGAIWTSAPRELPPTRRQWHTIF